MFPPKTECVAGTEDDLCGDRAAALNENLPDNVPRSRSAALIFAHKSLPGKLFATRELCRSLVCAPVADMAAAITQPLNSSAAVSVRKTIRIRLLQGSSGIAPKSLSREMPRRLQFRHNRPRRSDEPRCLRYPCHQAVVESQVAGSADGGQVKTVHRTRSTASRR